MLKQSQLPKWHSIKTSNCSVNTALSHRDLSARDLLLPFVQRANHGQFCLSKARRIPSESPEPGRPDGICGHLTPNSSVAAGRLETDRLLVTVWTPPRGWCWERTCLCLCSKINAGQIQPKKWCPSFGEHSFLELFPLQQLDWRILLKWHYTAV